MIWEFDFHSHVPLYVQIRSQVVRSLAKGELSAGEQLPTIRALSRESGINRMTISKGNRLLKTEGDVHTHRRCGTVVSKKTECADPTVPPYLLIKTSDGIYYLFGAREPETTRQYYERASALVANQPKP